MYNIDIIEIQLNQLIIDLKRKDLLPLEEAAYFQQCIDYTEIIGPMIFSYYDKKALTIFQDEEMKQLMSIFDLINFLLVNYFRKFMESKYKTENELIVNFIEKFSQSPINFSYVVKGNPPHYLISYDDNNTVKIKTIPAIGLHNICKKILKSDVYLWPSICFYSDKTKKTLLVDAYIQSCIQNS